ncbi:MAG: glycosyl transferase [Candidatus Zambryskibacteria bacterium RIFCSPLOWO2_02_FULL_39_14]|uniref:Glycosyl transferase n=1 Tax=Candidatus Zambryskibacteria bacterium RIFCSPLOWO2_02_FULL_39_14 TaxID=1802769 RepID=A0A1G2UI09_9BACT|nr:MAG: glycosyl transferase [Candidatus Zambryskibacteria bacterium RIFCSPLOWO2_02_FULL_39_14]
MKLSIILPIYNEAGNLEALYREIRKELPVMPFKYEIIAVNDGSSDGSYEILEKIAKNDKHFRVLHLSKNYGQTAALSAGIDVATGDILIPMDADLQNDPADISKFLALINQGYDVVAGWRKDRQDNFLRRLPSILANKLISRITGISLHDYGCTMKAYKREIIKDVRFYGEMHRFMPVYVAWHGAKIYELVINHRPRQHGLSKYGISRTFRVILDLLTVKFLMTYLSRPMHFFGWAGLASLLLSFISGVAAIVIRLFYDVHFTRTPLPLLTVFLIIMGVQFILMGLLAEILIRIYHEPRGRATYSIRSKINFDHE